MTRPLKWTTGAIAIFVLAGPAAAQQLDLVTMDDFVAPSQLGQALESLPGSPWFGALILSAGGFDDYRWMGRSPVGSYAFTRVAGDFYRGSKQLGFDVTVFEQLP